jgi:hypothetical protein
LPRHSLDGRFAACGTIALRAACLMSRLNENVPIWT